MKRENTENSKIARDSNGLTSVCGDILRLMRSRFSQTVVTLVLAICLVCPLVELFDHWDHTIQTGNDTEYALVVLALCVGVAYSFSRFIANFPLVRLITRSVFTSSVQISFRSAQFSFTSLLFNAISPPPLELRI